MSSCWWSEKVLSILNGIAQLRICNVMGRITASQGYPCPNPYHLWIHYTWLRRIMMAHKLKVANHLAYSRGKILGYPECCKESQSGTMWRCHTKVVKIGQGHSLKNRRAPQKLEKYSKHFSPTVPRTWAEPSTFGQRPSDNCFGLWLPEVKKPAGLWLLQRE